MCSDEERLRVETWISASTKNEELFDRLKRVWELSGCAGEEWDFAGPVKKLSAMMRETETPSSRNGTLRLYRITPKPVSNSISAKTIFQVAAAVVALVGTLYAVQLLREKALEKETRSQSRNFSIEEASTKPGQQATFKFADGTVVALNSASHLGYSDNPEGSRDVYLEGEAYFEVAHSENRPFVVHVGNETIKDIGTKFDVKAWSDDDNTKVAVVEGVVSIQPNVEFRKDIVVSRNQYCVINSNGVILPPTHTDVSRDIGWMSGKLVFHDAPMSEVVKQIWRRFGICCSVADTSILSKKITTSFDGRDPPKRVFDMIALSLNLTYKASEDSVIFMPSKTLFPNGSTKGIVRDLRERIERKQINMNDTSYEKGGFEN
jgi:ferric-dicitrate binding protein FerR (iron transport regulator)